ncbi:MAG TPA: PDZ domain-containing protein [Candidatus Acidoferrales bacterium]|jgi:hypothetical protein|nr:PDZ domain-containing protein [Candidatus Acidoferrales bacterium]
MKFHPVTFWGCCVLLCFAVICDLPSRAQSKQGTAQAPTPGGPPAAQFNYGGDAAEVPAEFVGNLVFLPVRINEGRPSAFFLDTSAASSSIDPGRLSVLGLAPSPRTVLSMIGVDVPFAPLPAIPRPNFGLHIGRAYDGTLGGDFFARAVVEIDYARQTVRLYDPSSYMYSGQGATLHLNFSAGLPVLQAKFTNQKGKLLEGDFVVSTANDDTLILFDHYAESHHILSEHWKTIPSVDPLLSAPDGGAAVARLKGFQIGNLSSQDLLVTFSKADLPGSNDPHLAGMIGAGFLSRFTAVFDYPHQQLILTPNSHFNSDDQEDKSGITVVAKGSALHNFEVVNVNPGSPTAKAGIQKGDVIAGVDQDAAADMTLAELRDLFRQIGHKYNLSIERNGQSRQIAVEMKRQL